MTDNIIDIYTGKSIRVDVPEDVTMAQWFDMHKKYARQEKVKSLLIVGIAEDGRRVWDVRFKNEEDLMKLYRECDKLKSSLDIILDGGDIEDDIIDIELD